MSQTIHQRQALRAMIAHKKRIPIAGIFWPCYFLGLLFFAWAVVNG